MANWDNLKSAIESVIKANGNQEITGQSLQNTLLKMVNSVGANATFCGVATPSTNPGIPDGPVFYLANTQGLYPNFGNAEISDEVAVLKWNNGAWLKFTLFHIDTTLTLHNAAADAKTVGLELYKLYSLLDAISRENTEAAEDSITIVDNNGNEIAKIGANGSTFKNLKSNGKNVLTEYDISELATKEDIKSKQDTIPQISQEERIDSSEEVIYSSNENEVYAGIGPYGIKAKAILDLNGNPFTEEKIALPEYFREEVLTTGNTIKSLAISSATIFNIVTDTHERYWEPGDVAAYDMSFENIRQVNKIYKSDALVHLGDILSPNDNNPGEKYYSQDVINAHLKSFFERMRNAHEKSVIMLGNHEDGTGTAGGDAKAIYPHVAIYDYSDNRYKNRPFFYINNNTGKVRSIFLCCPYQWDGKPLDWTFGQEQINWLIDTALNVEDGWHCIFFSHTPLVSDDMRNSDYKDVIGVINAFNNQTSFTTSYGKVANFSGKTGTKSVALVCGHEHCDLVVQPKDKTAYLNNNLDCPIIIVNCNYRYGSSGSVSGATYFNTDYRTKYNKNMDLWDTLIYRKDQSKIYMIRFGAGEDRIINI